MATVPDAPTITYPFTTINGIYTFYFGLGSNGGSPLLDVQYAVNASNYGDWYSFGLASPLEGYTTVTIQQGLFGAGNLFKIRSINAIGASPESVEFGISPIPSAPTLISAHVTNPTTAVLTFTLGSLNGGPPYTDLQYLLFDPNAFSVPLGPISLGLTPPLEGYTTATITDLPFVPYGLVFDVIAVSPAGSPESLVEPFTPTIFYPDPPTITSVIKLSNTSVTIGFILGSNQGSDLTDIQYATSDDSYATWTSLGLTAPLEGYTSVTISGLGFDPSNVSFKLREVNAIGISIPSDPVTTAAIPQAPTITDTLLVIVDGSTIQINFTLGSNNGLTLTDIQYASSADNYTTWTTFGLTAPLEGYTSATIGGLSPIPYGVYYQIRVVNSAGASEPSNAVMVPNDVPCFLEGTKILCRIKGVDKYVPIETIRPGMRVKTLLDGYKPVKLIGYRTINNPGTAARDKNSLYLCTKAEYTGLTENLTLTGCHAILVDRITETERTGIISILERIFVTDYKYRLPVCVDNRASVVQTAGTFTVWHFALEHDNTMMNYGVYAQGLLVESSSIWHMNTKNYTLVQ